MAYAENTSVPVERSRAEIERLLQRHKCVKFMAGVDNEAHRATVQFQAHSRIIRFEIDLPDALDRRYRKIKNSYLERNDAGVRKLVEQEERSRWRALLLVIKAKLEAVESNIATFEEESHRRGAGSGEVARGCMTARPSGSFGRTMWAMNGIRPLS